MEINLGTTCGLSGQTTTHQWYLLNSKRDLHFFVNASRDIEVEDYVNRILVLD
jgi:hypothetical protein